MSIVIAIDAMGGDHAPYSTVEGICKAARLHPEVNFRIFGDEAALRPLLQPYSALKARLEIIHTDERVTNETPAREALRVLKKSSMRLAIQDVAEGKAAAIVSAGNTGAYMALSKIILKTLSGIERPAIARTMPSQKGDCVMLDLGANVEVSAMNLVEFAIMGEAFACSVLHKHNPSVGLLNVGTEDLKGNATVRQAQDLLKTKNILNNYYGFVEGDDIFAGTTDVVVTDGFSGNIAIKTAEGCARFFANALKENMMHSWLSKIGAVFAASAFRDIKERLDPRNYNGAPLLGLRGIAVKSHGGTDAQGFARAIEVAIELVTHQVNDKIRAGISKISTYDDPQSAVTDILPQAAGE